jgi:hypothetical protein
MNRRGHRGKVDANQAAVVKELRDAGGDQITVISLAGVGDGCPDLLIGLAGQTYLAEVKDGDKSPSARKLTPDQVDWVKSWNGSPVYVFLSPDIARSWVKARLVLASVTTTSDAPTLH